MSRQRECLIKPEMECALLTDLPRGNLTSYRFRRDKCLHERPGARTASGRILHGARFKGLAQ